jgi:hypothetical protein
MVSQVNYSPWFIHKKIKFIVPEIRDGRGHPIRRMFMGGYPKAAELATVVTRVTPKKP